jgi:hypothetical protein
MADPNQPDLNERLHAAVSEALQGEGTLMVNRVVVLAEVMDDDGVPVPARLRYDAAHQA